VLRVRDLAVKFEMQAKPNKKAIHSVPKQFNCPFCNHSLTVDCKLYLRCSWMISFSFVFLLRDKVKSIGTIKCRVCDASYQSVINCKIDLKSSCSWLLLVRFV